MVLKAYNEAKGEIAHKDSIIAKLQNQLAGKYHKGESSTLLIASSPTKPPPTSPIIEFPPSPITFGFEATETIQDEMEKLQQAQALFANKYEEKVRGTILKFADAVGAFYCVNLYEKDFEYVD